jgi:CheY-like chemotaxis protein
MIEGKQILVVEDEIITAMDLQTRLKNLGYNVPVVVSSGEEAIKKVKENNPDLVLMDINLNGEMDGIEAASKIHSFRYSSNIPDCIY